MLKVLTFIQRHFRGQRLLWRRWIIAIVGMIILPPALGVLVGLISNGYFDFYHFIIQVLISPLFFTAGLILFPVVYWVAYLEVQNWWPLNPDWGPSGIIFFCMPGAAFGTLLLLCLVLRKTPTPALAGLVATGATICWSALIVWSAS